MVGDLRDALVALGRCRRCLVGHVHLATRTCRRQGSHWRRRTEAGGFSKIQELAEAVGLAERHVSRQLRLTYLAPEMLKRLTCGREVSAVNLFDLCFLAGETWMVQAERAFRDIPAEL